MQNGQIGRGCRVSFTGRQPEAMTRMSSHVMRAMPCVFWTSMCEVDEASLSSDKSATYSHRLHDALQAKHTKACLQRPDTPW